MMTYLLLNIVFMFVMCLVLRVKLRKPTRRGIIIFAILFVLTLLFDSLLVYFHIVEYTTSHILGITIGLAPLEDYFYPLLAVIMIPLLWKQYGDD